MVLILSGNNDKKEETDPFKDFGEEIQLSDEDLPF